MYNEYTIRIRGVTEAKKSVYGDTYPVYPSILKILIQTFSAHSTIAISAGVKLYNEYTIRIRGVTEAKKSVYGDTYPVYPSILKILIQTFSAHSTIPISAGVRTYTIVRIWIHQIL